MTVSNSVYQLNSTNSLLNNLLEQMQTGNRINKAADDASGMTIADALRSQASSLQQGTKNALDAKNLLNIVDGSLTKYKETLNSMLTKAVKSASDTENVDSRRSLQADINKYRQALDSISQNTTYNGMNLLNGAFINKEFQVGAYSRQTIDVSLSSVSSSKIGHLTETTSGDVTTGATGAFTLNGQAIASVTISATTKDGANLLSDAINLQTDITNIKAYGENSVTGTAITANSIASGGLTINGVSIGAVNFLDNDSSGTLTSAINSISGQTGVNAKISGSALVLESNNGENIHIVGADATNYGNIVMRSTSSITIGGTTTNTGLATATSVNYTMANIDVTTKIGSQRAIDILNSALIEINTQASNVGSTTNQLSSVISVNEVTTTNVLSSEQNIRGADLTEVSEQMSKLQIKYQAALFSLQKENEVQSNILSILR